MTQAERLARTVANNTGWIDDVDLDCDNVLWGQLNIGWLPGAQSDAEILHRLKSTIRFVSPEIMPGMTDGSGRTWGPHVSHCALTCSPVWSSQMPFGDVAMSYGRLRLSLANRLPSRDPDELTPRAKRMLRECGIPIF